MDVLTCIATTISRRLGRRAIARTDQASSLSLLPTELLLSIINYLDVSDVVCLALTHRLLKFKLCDRFHDLQLTTDNAQQQKEMVLQRIAQDRPELWCCGPCLRLHPCSAVPLPMAWPDRTLDCLAIDHKTVVGSFHGGHRDMSNYALSFPHVHLAMQRHLRGGTHGIPMQDLAVREIQTYSGEHKEKKITTLLSVEPEIISDELHMRVQTWALFPCCNPLDLDKLFFIKVCRHENIHGFLLMRFREARAYSQWATKAQPEDISLRCAICSAELEIAVRHYDDGTSSLTITKWLNFGPVDSYKHEKWQRHVLQPPRSEHKEQDAAVEHIQMKFERHSAVSQEQLTAENEAMLFTGQYRTFPQFQSYTTSYINWLQPNFRTTQC